MPKIQALIHYIGSTWGLLLKRGLFKFIIGRATQEAAIVG